jgi:hypothetical protein
MMIPKCTGSRGWQRRFQGAAEVSLADSRPAEQRRHTGSDGSGRAQKGAPAKLGLGVTDDTQLETAARRERLPVVNRRPLGAGCALIVTLHDPTVIRRILVHVRIAPSGPTHGPAHRSPAPPRPDPIRSGARTPRGSINAAPAGRLTAAVCLA